jgi:hypothetical protein
LSATTIVFCEEHVERAEAKVEAAVEKVEAAVEKAEAKAETASTSHVRNAPPTMTASSGRRS